MTVATQQSAQAWQLQLFALLCQYFDDGYTDALIRSLYADDGVALEVVDFDRMELQRCFVPGESMTPEFLREARALWKLMPKRR